MSASAGCRGNSEAAIAMTPQKKPVEELQQGMEFEDDCSGESTATGLESDRDRDPEEGELPEVKEEEEKEPHALAHLTRMMTAAHANSARFGGAKAGAGAVNACRMVAGREINVSGRGRFSRSECCHLGSRFLPREATQVLDKIGSRAYVGRFSQDGSLFVAGFQDRRIRIYDCDGAWKLRKNVIGSKVRWAICDTALSPDRRFLVYASVTPLVHLVNVGNENAGIQSLTDVTEVHQGLDFAAGREPGERSFGLFCVQFSQDGRELLAGSADAAIYLYDLERNKLSNRIEAHDDDVNSVVFADDSCNVLYSGSDDHVCKVWDRRCSARAAGFLQGHLAGITHLDTRGDGRFFISNGKDQCIKLWDIRSMTSDSSRLARSHSYKWDYRWMDYPGSGRDFELPDDQSVMTYRGHGVLKTLVRCYFSPLFSTAQKYIYTGSSDGSVYIYDLLTGQQAARLKSHHATVRDCSWHPRLPMLVSCSWDGVLLKWEPGSGTGPKSSSLPRLPRHSLRLHNDVFYDSD